MRKKHVKNVPKIYSKYPQNISKHIQNISKTSVNYVPNLYSTTIIFQTPMRDLISSFQIFAARPSERTFLALLALCWFQIYRVANTSCWTYNVVPIILFEEIHIIFRVTNELRLPHSKEIVGLRKNISHAARFCFILLSWTLGNQTFLYSALI